MTLRSRHRSASRPVLITLRTHHLVFFRPPRSLLGGYLRGDPISLLKNLSPQPGNVQIAEKVTFQSSPRRPFSALKALKLAIESRYAAYDPDFGATTLARQQRTPISSIHRHRRRSVWERHQLQHFYTDLGEFRAFFFLIFFFFVLCECCCTE